MRLVCARLEEESVSASLDLAVDAEREPGSGEQFKMILGNWGEEGDPTSNGGIAKWKHRLHTRFCMFGTDFVCPVGARQQNFCIGAQEEVY